MFDTAEKEALFAAVGDYVRELVAAELGTIQTIAGKDGENGKDGSPGEPGAPGVPGRDGKDADPLLIERLVADAIDKGLADRGGKDGRDGLPGLPGRDGKDGAPGAAGKDGLDGLGFDDLSIDYDGERTLVFKLARGEKVMHYPISLPIVIDRGVFKEGSKYTRGDFVTWGGSGFIAQRDTAGVPEKTGDWRLAVKRGQNGKDGKDGKPGERGAQGIRGISFDGIARP